jgi:hypothetical protein
VSAIVNLFLAIPAGRWLSKRDTNRAIFWTSVFYRIGFLLFIFLPWLFDNAGQVVAIILITLFMAIPLTPLGVGFNALFAEAVPDRYRAHVAGTRNVMLAITYHPDLPRQRLHPQQRPIPCRLSDRIRDRGLRRGDEQLPPLLRQTCAG